MVLRQVLALVALVASALVVPAGRATADDPAPTELALVANAAEVRIDQRVTLTATLTSLGVPVPDQPVRFEQQTGTGWQVVATGTTDPVGVSSAIVTVPSTDNRFRAMYDGAPSYSPATSAEVSVIGRKWSPALVIGGATRIVDERSGNITALWRLPDGTPLAGARVRLLQLPQGARSWTVVRETLLGSTGVGVFTIAPRVDTRYRLYGYAGRWWNAAHSAERFVDNLPPAAPWRDPARAPRPGALPAQKRAVGAGAHVVVMKVPDAVWDHMTGISWRRGCPVGRSGLRLIRANYWGFDGYRHRGELVVNAAISGKYAGALRGLYAARVPIRRMYRVDYFGYSSRSGGGDDFQSMAYDNTSAFNCRWVTGRPGVRSPHSTGRSWDINTWENPYRSRIGWLPNTWWAHRSDPRVAWRSYDHRVVRILRANGFRWTYTVDDSQHFDGRLALPGGGFSG